MYNLNMDSRFNDKEASILRAALSLFSAQGYQATTTRQIAKKAQVNLGLIPYYFRTKKNLYESVTHHVCDQLESRLQSIFPVLKGLCDKEEIDGDQLLRALDVFVLEILEIVTDKNLKELPPFVIREQFNPGYGFPILYDRIFEQAHETLNAVFCRIKGIDPQNPESILFSHALIGQFLIFHFHRSTILKRMQWQDYSQDELKQIHKVVMQNLKTLLLNH